MHQGCRKEVPWGRPAQQGTQNVIMSRTEVLLDQIKALE